jgi:hypothetical protein
MQPVAHRLHVAVGQLAESCLNVFDDRRGNGVRHRLGGQHMEEPSHRIADPAVEPLHSLLQGQAARTEDALETRWRVLEGGDRSGIDDRLPIAVKVLAYGDDPVIAELGGGTGAGLLPCVKEIV